MPAEPVQAEAVQAEAVRAEGAPAEPVRAGNRVSLLADCGSCFGLCCVALPFARSADFAVSKEAGQPCHHLQPDFGCGIHSDLRRQGFTGCTVYDCFGAGQKVSAGTYAGRDWRQDPQTGAQMFDVFAVMRQLHELLWYLGEALERARSLPRSGPAGSIGPVGSTGSIESNRAVEDPLPAELERAWAETELLADGDPESLLSLDVAAHRAGVSGLLQRTSERVRAGIRRPARHRGADLIGARLRGADLRGADLRGAYLIGADLRGADLGLADLLGADLRGADVGGADLSGSLFLTQFQLNATKGTAGTKLGSGLDRPGHWSAGRPGDH